MSPLSVDQLRQQVTLGEKDVELPELGGTVRVRALTVGKRARMRKGIVNGSGDITDPGELEIRMFVAGVCEPKVTREDAMVLKEQWSGDMWDRVMLAISEVGATDLDPEEVEAAAAAEFQGSDE